MKLIFTMLLSLSFFACASSKKDLKTVDQVYDKYGSYKEAPVDPVFTPEQLKSQNEVRESETIQRLDESNQRLQSEKNQLEGEKLSLESDKVRLQSDLVKEKAERAEVEAKLKAREKLRQKGRSPAVLPNNVLNDETGDYQPQLVD